MYIHMVFYNRGEGIRKGAKDMIKTMDDARSQAMEILASATMMDLIDEWELTTTVNDSAVYEVRGWLMDEIARREPEGFNAWLDSEDPRDEDLKDYVLR